MAVEFWEPRYHPGQPNEGTVADIEYLQMLWFRIAGTEWVPSASYLVSLLEECGPHGWCAIEEAVGVTATKFRDGDLYDRETGWHRYLRGAARGLVRYPERGLWGVREYRRQFVRDKSLTITKPEERCDGE